MGRGSTPSLFFILKHQSVTEESVFLRHFYLSFLFSTNVLDLFVGKNKYKCTYFCNIIWKFLLDHVTLHRIIHLNYYHYGRK